MEIVVASSASMLTFNSRDSANLLDPRVWDEIPIDFLESCDASAYWIFMWEGVVLLFGSLLACCAG